MDIGGTEVQQMSEGANSYRLGHDVFVLTLLAKGLLGAVQLFTALLLVLGVGDRLPAIAQWLVKAELAEDPNDPIASRIIDLASRFPGSDMTFYAIYFAAHGVLHLAVVAALFRGLIWSYAAAIVVLFAFVFYQIFSWFSSGGIMLLVLSAIDLLVIFLTYREWAHRSAARA